MTSSKYLPAGTRMLLVCVQVGNQVKPTDTCDTFWYNLKKKADIIM